MNGIEFTNQLKKYMREKAPDCVLARSEICFIPKGSKEIIPGMGEMIRMANQRHFHEDAEELLGDFLAVAISGKQSFILIWLEPFFSCMEEMGIETAMKMLIGEVEQRTRIPGLDLLGNLGSYEKIADHLILRPLFYEDNRERIENGLSIRYEDFALVLYLELPSDDEDIVSTTQITKEVFHMWKEDAEKVMRDALENTSRTAPASLCLKIDPQLVGLDIPMKEEEAEVDEAAEDFGVLSNVRRVNGAIALFYPGMMERLYRIFGGDYYVVFTSVHECALHKADRTDKDLLAEVLREINADFNQEDSKLSDFVYLYDGDRKKLLKCR